MTDCRIEFALLPTVCSLPVAFHPASRRRSYLQLSGAGLTQVRTFTQLFVCTCRRTRACRSPTRPSKLSSLMDNSQTAAESIRNPTIQAPHIQFKRELASSFFNLLAFPRCSQQHS